MIRFTILGQPVSKANSREIVTINGHPAVIKSKVARNYERDALRQIPPAARQSLKGPVRVTLHLYYASERSDLDESLLLDILQDRHGGRGDSRVLLQAGCYRNDRQVREKHVYHGIDTANPHADIEIEPLLLAQQEPLALVEPVEF